MGIRSWAVRRQDRHAEPEPCVRLTGRRLPQTPFERWLADVLMTGDKLRRSRLIELLTEKLFEQELRSGAGQVDAGVWGPALFRREVTHMLAGLEGDFVEEA